MKRPNRPGVFRIDPVQCSSGLAQLLKGDAAGTGPVLKFPSAIQPWPIGRLSADAAWGDSSTGRGAACGNAAQAAAARYEGERRNCCRFPVEYQGREANGRVRDTPESNTAPSSPADIASPFPRSHGWPAECEQKCRQVCGTKHAPSNWRDCAPWRLVCQEEYILLVGVRMPEGVWDDVRGGMADCGITLPQAVCRCLRSPSWIVDRPAAFPRQRLRPACRLLQPSRLQARLRRPCRRNSW